MLNGKNCPANCKDDLIAAPKPGGVLPFSNGCKKPSFKDLKGFYGDYSHFDNCCDMHNVCYMSCGTAKKTCDDGLKACMLKRCDRIIEEEQCIKTAQEMAMDRVMHGCKHYIDSQQFLCSCFEVEEAHGRVSDYAHQFFTVFNKTHELPESIVKKYLDRKPQSALHGELLYRLFKKYPESIDIVARDGKTQKKYPKHFDSFSAPENTLDDNDEL